MKKRILVTGGTGDVGKYLKDIMPDGIYISSKNCDLTNTEETKRLFEDVQPDSVVHLAARVGGIASNIKYPVEFFQDNILMNTNVLKFSMKQGVKDFIGILSTCIYPDHLADEFYPMTEERIHDGPPSASNFSYGYSKRSMAVLIDAYNHQYSCNYSYLVPCNLFGKYDFGNENTDHFITAVIRRMIKAERQGSDTIEVWGTGKPLRQFMYAGDLARAIKMILDEGKQVNCNIAPEWNMSINSLTELILKTCGSKLKIKYNNDKPDGQFRKDVDSTRFLSVFPDFQFTPLEQAIKTTYDFAKNTL